MGFEPKFVTVRMAAKMLDRKVRTGRGWIHSEKIKAIKDSNGHRWLIYLDEVERILNQEKEFDAIFSEGKQDADKCC